MCLKYFVEHTSCEHYEYLGSHHCSNTPCDLGIQHFHYIDDDFPVPIPPKSQQKPTFDQVALACNICTTEHRDKLDPDEVPVKHFPPTNDFNVEETRPTGYFLPIKVIRVEKGDLKQYDFDYKSLSDADEDEWKAVENPYETAEVHVTHEHIVQKRRAFVQEQVAKQLRNLPNYLELQRQGLSFMQPVFTPETYGVGKYLHCPTPRIAFLAPPPILSIAQCHGGTQDLSSVQTMALPLRPSETHSPPMQAYAMKDTIAPTTPAMTPGRPTLPVPTSTIHPLPLRPTPPFIVGTLTDAYLRMETAKRRHMRERTRRARSSLRDALPPRSMSLADCMVKKKKSWKWQRKDVAATGNVDTETWSSSHFAGEELDTEDKAKFTEKNGGKNKRYGFSCRLVTLM